MFPQSGMTRDSLLFVSVQRMDALNSTGFRTAHVDFFFFDSYWGDIDMLLTVCHDNDKPKMGK